MHGIRQLKLLNHGETYEMNCPNLLLKILPVPGAVWAGTVKVRCQETDLVAELSYISSHSFLGFGGNHRVIKGKILDSSSSKVLYELDGHWDRYYLPSKHFILDFLINNIEHFVEVYKLHNGRGTAKFL